MTLREQMENSPNRNFTAAMMYILYNNNPKSISFEDPEVLIECNKLAQLSDQKFEQLVQQSIKSKYN